MKCGPTLYLSSEKSNTPGLRKKYPLTVGSARGNAGLSFPVRSLRSHEDRDPPSPGRGHGGPSTEHHSCNWRGPLSRGLGFTCAGVFLGKRNQAGTVAPLQAQGQSCGGCQARAEDCVEVKFGNPHAQSPEVTPLSRARVTLLAGEETGIAWVKN